MSSHNLFISYAREDSAVVETICKEIKGQGLSYWIDSEGLRWGDSFPSKMAEAVTQSQYVLLCISKAFAASMWCRKELDLAITISNRRDLENRPHILPLLLDGDPSFISELPIIQDLHCRAYDGNPRKLAVAMAHLGCVSTKASQQEWAQTDRGEFSVNKLIDYASWLPRDRRLGIISTLAECIPSLQKHRRDHVVRLKERWKGEPHLVDRNEPAWVRVNKTHSVKGLRLTIGFRNTSCEYRKTDPLSLGCFNCGYYAGSGFRKATVAQLIEQVRRGFAVAFRHGLSFDVVEFLSDGSFLSNREMDDEAKLRIFRNLAQMSYVKRILIESTPEHVFSQRDEIPQLLDCLRPDDQTLEIGIGLETADDFIRKACINKGFERTHFERAVEHIARINKTYNGQCSVVAYLLVKPAFLSTAESIEDIIKALIYLSDFSKAAKVRIVPKLEPAAVADGTLLSYLHMLDESCEYHYAPLNYWMILEILTRSYLDERCRPAWDCIRVAPGKTWTTS